METAIDTPARELEPRGIFSIPAEILLMISEVLTVPSRVALSLTCKQLYAILFPKGIPDLTRKDTTEVLLCLERQLPGYYWCHFCNHLVPFNSDGYVPLTWHSHFRCLYEFSSFGDGPERDRTNLQDALQSRASVDIGCLWEGPLSGTEVDSLIKAVESYDWPSALHRRRMEELHYTPCIPVNFADAHIIMKRHLFGETHGFPVSMIESKHTTDIYVPNTLWHRTWFPPDPELDVRTIPIDHFVSKKLKRALNQKLEITSQQWINAGFRTTASRRPWNVSREVIPRIIDDNLYISTVHTILAPRGSGALLPLFFSRLKLHLCAHMPLSGWYHPPRKWRLWWDYNGNRTQCLVDKYKGKIVSCSACLSDGRLAMSKNPETGDWTMKLQTYHRLGQCRTPHDEEWVSMIHGYGDACIREEGRLGGASGRLGGVHSRWYESMGVAQGDDLQANWAGGRRWPFGPYQWAGDVAGLRRRRGP